LKDLWPENGKLETGEGVGGGRKSDWEGARSEKLEAGCYGLFLSRESFSLIGSCPHILTPIHLLAAESVSRTER